jgi:hypothetical protein
VPPSGALPPPGAPPTAPTRPPLTGISSSLVVDLTEASRLVSRGAEMLDTVPRDDVGAESTKDLRIRIFKTNMAAQKRIEKQLTGNPEAVVSELRRADAYLEDANWQLAKKPSPDGRFNGVDIPGAIRDTAEGARVLNELLLAAGGAPSTPTTPPPGGPPSAPPGVPPTPPPSVPPSTPPSTPPAPWPTPGNGGDEPGRPPSTPPGVPTTPPPGNGGGDDYPGEDEFPKDGDTRTGGDG